MKTTVKVLLLLFCSSLAQLAGADEVAHVSTVKGKIQQVDMQHNRITIGGTVYVLPSGVGAVDKVEGGTIGQNHLNRGTVVKAKVVAGKQGEPATVLEMEILQYSR